MIGQLFRRPEWRNGRRTGLKNSLLAILGRHASSLATRIKPLIPLVIYHFLANSRRVSKKRDFLTKLAQNLAQARESPVRLAKACSNAATRSRVVIRLARKRRQAECQNANTPLRQVLGSVGIGPKCPCNTNANAAPTSRVPPYRRMSGTARNEMLDFPAGVTRILY